MRPLHVLIVPDKFKGTLDAKKVAQAIARGWRSARPSDCLEIVPMSDGGDGFASVMGEAMCAIRERTETVNAAHELIWSEWWRQPASKTAIIESARVIGLAMLPAGKFHPFKLDTFGLGRLLDEAHQKGCRKCLIGIGGSATNDGGFGLARALGWTFLDRDGKEIITWTELSTLKAVLRPPKEKHFEELIVAVDVTNPLLGENGCSAVYGPQKGLRSLAEIDEANHNLTRLSTVLKEQTGVDFSKTPGAGAAGGLGFGLMTFAGAIPQPGFEIFSGYTGLEAKMQRADLVITGEGKIDEQTMMGKGVGQIALAARRHRVRCLAIAGEVTVGPEAKGMFSEARSLMAIASSAEAKANTEELVASVSGDVAKSVSNRPGEHLEDYAL